MNQQQRRQVKTSYEQQGCLRRYRYENNQVTANTRLKLIFFPCAGAGASIFRELTLALPDTIDPWIVQLPGREDRIAESGISDMDDIVAHIIETIAPMADERLVFFGHSMGAFIAYEVALAMETKLRKGPLRIIVSGQGAPSFSSMTDRCHHSATDAEFIANLIQLGGTPKAVLEDQSLLQMLLPTVRNDYKLLDNYQPALSMSLKCEITACSGKKDLGITKASLAGWQDYTSSDFTKHWLMGDHFYFNRQTMFFAKKLESWAVLR